MSHWHGRDVKCNTSRISEIRTEAVSLSARANLILDSII